MGDDVIHTIASKSIMISVLNIWFQNSTTFYFCRLLFSVDIRSGTGLIEVCQKVKKNIRIL